MIRKADLKQYRVRLRKGIISVNNAHLRLNKNDNFIHFEMTIEEIKEAMKKSCNKDFALRVFIKEKELAATFEWANNSKTEILKQKRLAFLEGEGLSAAYEYLPYRERVIDDICRDIKKKLLMS